MIKKTFTIIISLTIVLALLVSHLPAQHAHSEHTNCEHAHETTDKDHNHSEESANVDADHPEKQTFDKYDEHKHDHAKDANDEHEKNEKKTENHAIDTENKHDHDHDHDEGNVIELSAEQQKESGIGIAVAGPGNLAHDITLNGEISVNTETLIHHTARAAGIPEKIPVSPGDQVKKNDLLAVIDSAELAEAKSAYYQTLNETALSLIDQKRAATIKTSTSKLLERLQKDPELDDLHNTRGDMGEHRARLLTAVTEYITAKKAFERRQSLFSDRIISETDFLTTRSAFEKAKAGFFSVLDTTRFEITQNLFDKDRQHKINEFKLRSLERRLRILGLTTREIETIKKQGSKIDKKCMDKNGHTCSRHDEHQDSADEDNFSRIYIKAGKSGTIISRNLQLGEKVPADRIIFTIADLSDLWALLHAPVRDISLIKPGMPVTVTTPDGYTTSGKVLLIDPIIDEKSRTATIRVALNNEKGRLFPGSFITGTIKVSDENLPLVIERTAVQNIDGESVVFIPTKHGFRSVVIRSGREDGKNIEILKGLTVGEQYVSNGAFSIKAALLTRGLDPHAGHGH